MGQLRDPLWRCEPLHLHRHSGRWAGGRNDATGNTVCRPAMGEGCLLAERNLLYVRAQGVVRAMVDYDEDGLESSSFSLFHLAPKLRPGCRNSTTAWV